MKIRTFLTIVVLLVAMFALSSFFFANRDVLGQPLQLWRGTALNVGLTLFLFLVLGVVLSLFVGISHELGLMIERSRIRKAGRKSEEIEEEYSRGLVAVLEGHEEKALGHFRAVLERDSRHFNTLLKLGEVLRSQGRHAEAIEYHRKAQHLREDDTQPLYALVEDFEAMGELERARAMLGRIIGVNKNSVAAWRKLRSLHIKERNWEKALEAQQKVRKLAGASDAKEHADRRAGLGIRFEIAAARFEAGKKRDAMGLLRRCIKEEPRFVPAHVLLGHALQSESRDKDAVQAWLDGFRATGSPVLLAAIEDSYLEREQPLAAIEALKRAIASSSKDALPRFYLGKLYYRLEMLDDAQAVLSSLTGRAAYAPSLHFLLGKIHERRGNFREAAIEYRQVIKETDLVQLDYRCRLCESTVTEWSPRCQACGEWNTVEVNFREETSPEELGLAPAPIYTSRR